MAIFESQYSLTSPWAEMWKNTEAEAPVLLAMLLRKYGEQSLDWDPLTIRMEIQEDYHVAPADEVMNKICAMQLVMSSSDFFERIDTFINVCNTIAEGDPFFEVFTPVEPEEIAYALSVVAMSRDMLPFNPTIRRYVKEVLKNEGFDENNFPEIFSVIFDRRPSSREVRKDLSSMIVYPTAAESNEKNIYDMLSASVGRMFSQFNRLPEISKVDDHILEQGVLLSLKAM